MKNKLINDPLRHNVYFILFSIYFHIFLFLHLFPQNGMQQENENQPNVQKSSILYMERF